MGNCLWFNAKHANASSTINPPTPADFSATTHRREGKSPMPSEEGNNLIEFSLAHLKRCTSNFSKDFLLGGGDSGSVYRGWVDETTFAPSKIGIGMPVAIKRIHSEYCHKFQNFQQVASFLRGVSHPNIVKVFGYCQEDNQTLLVYEYMKRGSLAAHLTSGSAGRETLSWDLRLKIAIEAARGLAFLHTSEKKAIFKDLKASNILLDENYNAELSGVGLADELQSASDEAPVGKLPESHYIAPETMATGSYSMKTDVYSYGLVLLVLLTGLREFDLNRPKELRHLSHWLKPILSNAQMLKNVMDVRMEGQYSSKAMMQVAEISSKCIERNPKDRPSMNEVVEGLEQIQLYRES